MIHKKTIGTDITYFFLGEYFSDALRNTFTVVIPIFIFFYLGNVEAATGIGVGALLISLTDLPDNKLNKLKTAVYSIVVFFMTTLVVSLTLEHQLLLAVLVTVAAFAFSMSAVYGSKVGLIGTMALIVSTFIMGLQPKNPVHFSLYLLVGGIWYYLVSLLQILIRPYRSLHHAIFECLMSSAAFLRSKAKNYDLNIPFDPEQKESVKLHIQVNQKHELIRNLLLTDKLAMRSENKNGQLLLGRALLLIDLHEQLNALHYDYALVRNMLAEYPGLQLIAQLIELLADELQDLGKHVRSTRSFTHKVKKSDTYLRVKQQLFLEEKKLTGEPKEMLMKIAANMDDIAQNIHMIRGNEMPQQKKAETIETEIVYPLFITGDQFLIKEHLSLRSPIFRFAVRLSIAFAFGFLLIWQLEPSRYSYWLFLTMVIVARPKFSLTWKRNQQRLQGSIIGAAIGLTIIYFIKSPAVLISCSVIFLLGFYAFNRLNYAISVLFITPAVILTLGSYHGHFDHIIHDRIFYTAIGCLISILATYIFPVWDSRQLENKLANAAKYSIDFLLMALALKGNTSETTKRMARKNANINFAQLAEAIDSAKFEPMTKRLNFKALYGMQISLYQINAIIASINLSAGHKNEMVTNKEQLDSIIRYLTHFDAGNNVTGYIQKYPHSNQLDYVDQKLKHIGILAQNFHQFYLDFKGA